MTARPVIVLCIGTLLLPACGGGRVVEPAGARDERPVAAPERFVVLPDEGATALAAAVVVPGSAWELPDMAGLTLLTAWTLLEGAAARLDSLGASASVRCDAAAFTFTLLAAPDRQEEALDAFLAALFRPRPDPAALERARARVTAAQRLERMSPARQARIAAREALFGDDDGGRRAWAGAPCGGSGEPRLSHLRFVEAAANRFDARRATAAVTGAIDSLATGRTLARFLGPEPLATPFPAPPRTRPGRRFVELNTVTAWTVLAFPFGAEADPEALRFVAALLRTAVEPGVERPEVLSVATTLSRHARGGVLNVHLVTTPGAAGAVAERVEAEVAVVAAGALAPAVRSRVLARHRGERLAELSVPERRVSEAALSLALPPHRVVSWSSAGRLPAGSARAAARLLGQPARAVVGPEGARGGAVP